MNILLRVRLLRLHAGIKGFGGIEILYAQARGTVKLFCQLINILRAVIRRHHRNPEFVWNITVKQNPDAFLSDGPNP
jgi:hypothetical protein